MPGKDSILPVLAVLAALSTQLVLAEFEVPERRKSQFADDSGYYVIPSPYSIPGFGEGFLVAGAWINAKDTPTDLYGFTATGDIQGYGLFATDLHLIDNRLILDLSATQFSKASATIYPERGMNSDPDSYVLTELDRNDFAGARLTYTLYQRRLELYALLYRNQTRLAAIRDRNGDLIQSAEDAELDRSQSFTYGLRLDLTDDYTDPRRGIRLESSIWHSPPEDSDSPDYDILELNLTGYIPVYGNDTLVLNFFEAATHVSSSGLTDEDRIEDQLGIDCGLLSGQLRNDCRNIVNDRIAQNTYGSVGALGGLSRLRAFPEDRFKGSKARFFGIEYRMNLLEDAKPFDIFIARDVRTVLQVAAFYERGAITDHYSELSSSMRDVWGLGARLVTRSGLVFRADYATGDEGEELSVIFGYPWEVF